MKYFSIIIITILLAGCAKNTQDIAPQYVSSMSYQTFNCSQLQGELDRINNRSRVLGGVVNKQAQNDRNKAALGIIITPLIFLAMDGNSTEAAEYGRLKGEFQAIKNTAISKRCPFISGQ